MLRAFLGSLVLGIAVAPLAQADADLVGIGTVPGSASDLSGLTGKQTDGTPHDQFGGISALAYTGRDHEYVLVSDRGPKDGASDFACRVHRAEIRITPGASLPITVRLKATTLLSNESGRRLVGSAASFHLTDPAKALRFDPEGISLGRTGTIYLSDEYGPMICEFDAEGKRLRSLPVPKHFRPAIYGKNPVDELPPKNAVGRMPNRGLEGLAISPDGKKLYGLMQSPLLQDGGLDAAGNRSGMNCRLLELDAATGKTREFVYVLDSPANGLNEILAINDREFLVIERDGQPGSEARFKKIVRIDLANATDVSGIANLPVGELPPSIIPVKKAAFIDLLAPKFKIAGPNCPEKFEGLAFGPELPNGKRSLIVAADNDFVREQPVRFYAFEIDADDLMGFRRPEASKR